LIHAISTRFHQKKLKIALEQQISAFFDETLGIDPSSKDRLWVGADDFCNYGICVGI
jgi:hypothetical protein